MSSLNAPYASGDSGATFLTEINSDLAELNTDKAEITGQEFSGKVKFSGTTHAGLQLLSLTTTERDALTPINGDLIYNETDDKVQMRQGGAWVDVTSVASDASKTVKGVVEIATEAEIEAGTSDGTTGAKIVVPADSSHLPNDNAIAAIAGTSGTPSGSNKFVTDDDVASAKTASKIARRDGNSDVLVATTPTDSDAATSKTYVDAISQKLDLHDTAITVASSTSETDIYTKSVPGGTLGTGNGILLKLWVKDFGLTDGTGKTATFRLKYGSTTITTVILTDNAAGNITDFNGSIDVLLMADGSATAQSGSMAMVFAHKQTTASQPAVGNTDTGTATETSSGDLDLKVTVQFSDSSAADKITVVMASAQIIK